MIPEPGETNREVPMNETFHVQTDDELTEKELKQIEADDQAIQTILFGLPKDIYAPVDSCETAQEIWISSNPPNRQIAQLGMNMGQDRQMQMVGGNANQNLNGKGNLVAVRTEGNATRHNGNQIRCCNYSGVGHLARNCTVRPRRRDAAYLQTRLLIAQKEEAGIQLQAKEFDLMAVAADLNEIEEVNANCILMANLQQALTLGTQTDKAPVCDSDGSAEVHNYENCDDNEIFNMFTQEEQYTELLEPILEPHQVPQNDNNVISENGLIGVPRNGNQTGNGSIVVARAEGNAVGLYRNQIRESEWNGLIGVQRNGIQNQIGNGNLVAARAEGNAAGQNANQIRCYNCRGLGHYARNCTARPRRRDAAYLQTQLLIAQKEEAGIQLQAEEYDLMATAADLDEIKEVNANCILMANL
nr:hypothetical protein [Tanacetum cinerariifolium]